MSIDRSTAVLVGDDILEAVNEVLARHGLAAGRHTVKYGDYLTFSIDAAPDTPSKNGINASSKEATAWIREGTMWGFADPTAVIGETITQSNRVFAFSGLRTRARTQPLLFTELATGKQYSFGPGAVKKLPGYDSTQDFHNR